MAINQFPASGLAGDTLVTKINTTGDDRSDVNNYYSTTFIFGLSYQVSDYLITVLQDYFQSNDLTKALNTRLGKVHKQVTVLDEFTPDTIGLPQIVVKSMPAESMPISLGNRIGKDTYGDEIFDVYGGQVLMNTTLEIYDSGKSSVHELADLVFLGIMQYIPNRLQTKQMIIDQARIRFANATRVTGTNVGGEVYRIPLTLPIRSEWRQYMKINTVDIDTIRNVPTPPETSLK